MARTNNYMIQAAQAKKRFLTYDQDRLIAKFRLESDMEYLYVNFLRQPYRISRKTGDMERRAGETWLDGNSYEEVMTLLDLLCDSREDRLVAGRWRNMASFGRVFHQELLEQRDPFADRIQADPDRFVSGCEALGGIRESGADLSFSFDFFDGLPLCVQFWYGDEEFYPRTRFLWDENADQYLRYETMYFAVALLRRRILERM